MDTHNPETATSQGISGLPGCEPVRIPHETPELQKMAIFIYKQISGSYNP